jgi:hypothetical protein
MSVAIVHQQVSGRQATEYSARAYSLPISSPFKIFCRKVGFQLKDTVGFSPERGR